MLPAARDPRFGSALARSSVSSRALAILLAAIMIATLLPGFASAARDDQTIVAWVDGDSDGTPELFGVDWDGDGLVDEWWYDDDDDGVIDRVETANTGGDTSRSPRGKPGMRVKVTPLRGGGSQVAPDWDGDGRYDEVWWDMDGDGTVDDTDIFKTESKIVDNTKATRFRGVFVGVKNGLNHPEKDVQDMTTALSQYPASWDPADMNSLTGAAATPAAIQGAIDAAKASSKPGDEFVFYFSGHGGGWNKEKGKLTGGRIDTDGDEVANTVPESDFGRFDGSSLPTSTPGNTMCYPYDLDGDGNRDTEVIKNSSGVVEVWRKIGGTWKLCGSDADGDGDVDGDDGGVDVNGDGDKDDLVGIDDTILVAGGAKISDDQLRQWLSGFPESVTIVVILDSCHSGSFVNDMKNVKDNKGMPLKPGHLEVVAAADWDKSAWELPISNGVLTQAILDALTPLGPGITGGHTTSYADFLGNQDDRTTTAELFEWAGASAVTYQNLDNDADGLRNEDAASCDWPTPTEYSTQATIGVDGPSVEPGVEHISIDDDGDIDVDEDPPVPPDSFFDVYYAPDFGDLPTERLLTCFSGDDAFDASGLGPEVRVWSQSGIETGTPETPGPTFQLSIREVPRPVRPEPVEEIEGLMEYASDLYDIELFEVEQWPGLEDVTSTVEPGISKADVGATPRPGVKVSLKPFAGIDKSDCIPVMFNPGPMTFTKCVPWEENDKKGTIEFTAPHYSMFALLYVGPAADVDTTGPDMGDTFITARSDGPTVTVAWSPPTDEGLDRVRVLRSMLDFPTSHDPPPGVYLAFDVQNEVSQEETLPLGTYYYSMFASDWAGNWSSEPVTCTVTVSTLRDPCAIEGQITHMGAPVEGIGVNLYEKDGSEWQWFKGEVSSLEPYFFDKLEPGTFRVGCYDSSHKMTRKYYKNATTFANAEDIVLTEGQGATGIDIALEGLGDIGGTVTSSGLGVQDITVKMYRWTGTSWLWVRDSITGPTGDYLATGLREGDYRVSFYDPSGTYVREWFDDVSSAAEASSVPVFSDTLTGGIDADIVKVTQLGGAVTDSGGAPLPGISVLIYNNATGIWRWRRTTTTDADGLWGTSGLDPGEYRVSFLDPGGTYIREYWDDWTVFNRSDVITITAGESRGGIDAELAGLGTISGLVTDQVSSPVGGLAVKAYRLGPLGFRWYRDAITLGDGTYTMPNLREGTYRVSFHDPGSLWAREWYDNAPSITLADDLFVTAGGHLSSIDASVTSSPW